VVPKYFLAIYEDFSIRKKQKFAVEKKKKSEPRGDPLHNTHLGAKNDKGGPSTFWPVFGVGEKCEHFRPRIICSSTVHSSEHANL
jgi:hypothetical protein